MKNTLRDSTADMHSAASSTDPHPMEEKTTIGAQVEPIHTNERVPGHPGYYEKGGLRTYGDDEDHDHEPPVRFSQLGSSLRLKETTADEIDR